MTGKLVQQQMYTRERGGIFHATDGYDTIAISEGLDKAFVKKYLHPFCNYYSPKTLTERGEKNASLYPEAVTMFQPETGDLVIGQAVFVPADFTGQRSTYFMHNYIIPPNRKNEWIKQPAKLFQLNEFKTSYDRELGNVLPERDFVGFAERDIFIVKNQLLEKLGITIVNFKQLLFAVMTSIAGKKKVFISLNVPLQEYTKYALQLLELIYFYLPYAHRRKLGVMTFSSEPEGKNYINVIFFEPGTLKLGDRSIEKQFIFDFANGRISGIDIAGQQHEYLEFAFHHFSESKIIDDFLEFAEMALSGLSDEQKLELSSYYQLIDLFLSIDDNDFMYYKKNKIGFLHSLLKFLQVNSDDKPGLVGLFLKLLKEEQVADDSIKALDYIHAVVSINTIVRSDIAHSFILDTLEYYINDPLFHKLWKTIEQDKLCHEAILMFINDDSDYKELLELYLEERFKHVHKIEDLLGELKSMLQSPFLLGNDIFKSIILKKVTSAITYANNPFNNVRAVNDFTIEMQNAEFSTFKNNLIAQAKLALLRSICLQELTVKDILAFGEIFTKGINVIDIKEMRVKENYLISNALYQLISNPTQANTYNLRSLTGAARVQLKDTLQQILRSNPSSEHFQLLFLAYGTDDGVDYQNLMEHLVRYSNDKTMLSFIKGNVRLLETDNALQRSLRKYLIGHPKSIWKNKTLRKELKNIQSDGLKKLLNEVVTETASPFVKFLKQYGINLS